MNYPPIDDAAGSITKALEATGWQISVYSELISTQTFGSGSAVGRLYRVHLRAPHGEWNEEFYHPDGGYDHRVMVYNASGKLIMRALRELNTTR